MILALNFCLNPFERWKQALLRHFLYNIKNQVDEHISCSRLALVFRWIYSSAICSGSPLLLQYFHEFWFAAAVGRWDVLRSHLGQECLSRAVAQQTQNCNWQRSCQILPAQTSSRMIENLRCPSPPSSWSTPARWVAIDHQMHILMILECQAAKRRWNSATVVQKNSHDCSPGRAGWSRHCIVSASAAIRTIPSALCLPWNSISCRRYCSTLHSLGSPCLSTSYHPCHWYCSVRSTWVWWSCSGSLDAGAWPGVWSSLCHYRSSLVDLLRSNRGLGGHLRSCCRRSSSELCLVYGASVSSALRSWIWLETMALGLWCQSPEKALGSESFLGSSSRER